jgi:hypothetical protein
VDGEGVAVDGPDHAAGGRAGRLRAAAAGEVCAGHDRGGDEGDQERDADGEA